MRLVIGHVYPEWMNLYGDRGNIIVLAQRARWRGMDVEVRNIQLHDQIDGECDLFFIGGGQDREQLAICKDLEVNKGPALKELVGEGRVLLTVCGGYQLMGQYYRTGDGTVLPGISLMDAWTVAGDRRCIGDVIVESPLSGDRRTLVGFENHSGKTYLGPAAQPLGKVMFGNGNNGEDRFEGAVQGTVYGTYLHGSLLPKNPWLADHLITQALRRRYGDGAQLAPLDDAIEERAHQAIIARIRRRGKLRTGVT
ncbi:MAG: glutamine amidotransferase [Chloroflexi bacterium]|nr:glutamine amidotransferase [Chloroflexota bacterium]